ncbi:hypothetical protein PIIN_07676 [Serendipita indica DSM 11827]|uniref:Uncharacterized protein n=1 Tax=Serendipita indica (strain DSM 11827) TaxID=1109443 RepID=G4TQX8_SERID|nr:hypothetical protein PIIN_07676 [Serendipita indica DSM 11827]
MGKSIQARVEACGIEIDLLLRERPDKNPKTHSKPPNSMVNNDKPFPPLPYDILCYFLFFLPDFYTLRDVILSGRPFYDAYVSRRERVLGHIMRNQFGLGAPGALRLAALLLDFKAEKASVRNGDQWLEDYRPEYSTRVLKQTKWIHKVTHACLQLYLTRWCWLPPRKTISQPPVIDLFSEAAVNFERAFITWWTLCVFRARNTDFGNLTVHCLPDVECTETEINDYLSLCTFFSQILCALTKKEDTKGLCEVHYEYWSEWAPGAIGPVPFLRALSETTKSKSRRILYRTMPACGLSTY